MRIPSLLIKLLIAATYMTWVMYYASDIPYWDDFDVHLKFLLDWLSSASWPERLPLLLGRNGEHFVLTNKVITLIDYYVFGNLNFFRLTLYGNILFIIALLLLSRRVNMPPLVGIWLLATILIPHFPQACLWTITAIENLDIFLWAILAFSLAERSSLLAIPIMLIATLTQGNGCLVASSWVAALLLAGRTKTALRWVPVALACLLPFVLFPGSATHMASSSLGGKLRYICIFLGASIAPSPQVAFPLGVIIVLGALGVLQPLARTRPQLCAFLLWLFVTVGANAMARAGLGADYSFYENRYRVVSSLALVCALAGAWVIRTSTLQRRLVGALGILVFIAICTMKLPPALIDVEFRRQDLLQSALRFELFGTGLSYPDPHAPVQLVKGAEARGIFTMPSPSPALFYAKLENVPVLQSTGERIIQKLEWQLCSQEHLYLQGYSFDRHEQGAPIALISSGRGSYKLLRPPELRVDVARHHPRFDSLWSGLSALIPLAELGPGPFVVTLGIQKRDGSLLLARKVHTINAPCG